MKQGFQEYETVCPPPHPIPGNYNINSVRDELCDTFPLFFKYDIDIHGVTETKLDIITQVYALSADSVLSDSTGLTRYSVPANESSFDKKISPSDCVFQLILCKEKIFSTC